MTHLDVEQKAQQGQDGRNRIDVEGDIFDLPTLLRKVASTVRHLLYITIHHEFLPLQQNTALSPYEADTSTKKIDVWKTYSAISP
jgi:hypothetical protein